MHALPLSLVKKQVNEKQDFDLYFNELSDGWSFLDLPVRFAI